LVTGDKIIKVLKKAGFEIIRQRGSHVYLKHKDGRATVVPIHRGRDIDRSLLRKIMRDIDMERGEFLRLF